MSGWLGSLWSTVDENVDLEEEISKLTFCSAEQKQLISTTLSKIHSVITQGHSLFIDNEDQAKNLIRRCIWACHHFLKDIKIIRESLEIILVGIKQNRTQSKTGVNYLHLMYTDILFEELKENKEDQTNKQSNMRILLKLLSINDFQIRYHVTSILQLIMKNKKTDKLQVNRKNKKKIGKIFLIFFLKSLRF